MGELKKDIGQRIRQLRQQAKLTLETLGAELGVGKSSVSGYENGDSYPNPESLIKIAEIGNVTLDWLIAGVESKQLNRQIHGLEAGAADTVLWCAVIEAVEEHLQGNNQQLVPAKKAELITTLYEMFSEEEGKQVDKKTVAKLIKLAS